jgi:hypothetical protein
MEFPAINNQLAVKSINQPQFPYLNKMWLGATIQQDGLVVENLNYSSYNC